MRLIRTLIHEDDRENVVAVLEDENIDYVIYEESSGRGDLLVVEFPVPEQALEVVLARFDEAGHDEHAYTVAAEATSALSENMGEVEDRFVVGEEEDSSIAVEELRSQVLGLLPDAFTYYLLTCLSAIVATAGLLLDAPALVVGSMVIAPLVGSALTASLGTVLADRDMIIKGFRTQLLGLGMAILGSIAFGYALRTGVLLPPSLRPSTTAQIAQRISPGLLSLVIGVCAGAAGAVSIATGISAALVGVMIAAALIPAAAAVSVGVIWSEPTIALGALVLLAVNAASIHVSGVAVFWYLGYRPTEWDSSSPLSNVSIRQYAPSFAVAVVLLVVFVTAGGAVWTHVSFNHSANVAVEQALSQERYDRLELVGVQVGFNPGPRFAESQQVTVTVRRPTDESYPKLSERLRRQIVAQSDREPTVVVEFVASQRTPLEPGTENRSNVRAGAVRPDGGGAPAL
ncbi:TIGR00341 family protein [Halogeometricum sp. S1BR25-6]|uniref:TIGR00341 family protein n=1 Tax=Halogeometricum salsisoli TaxID=2950536 RepID=A0ABU2GCN6_9EURY|nr:TIGR00341 family protein [Halogeometricum sp. S1BR25-6]MDS0298576.1 TIGR00341 family protein [Halogeometricum sp. S1BR25-6]